MNGVNKFLCFSCTRKLLLYVALPIICYPNQTQNVSPSKKHLILFISKVAVLLHNTYFLCV